MTGSEFHSAILTIDFNGQASLAAYSYCLQIKHHQIFLTLSSMLWSRNVSIKGLTWLDRSRSTLRASIASPK